MFEEIFERFEKNNPNPQTELIAKNEYTFCIAVLLSAQTSDRAVNKATGPLFEIADSPEKMIALGGESLKTYIKTLGLCNNKTKNIMLLSARLVENFHSKIPFSRAELESLPGIGRKTANVLLNSLFQEPFIAVDTHVLRVAKRIGLTKSCLPLQVEKDLLEVVPQRFHKNVSNWLVLHGRYVCKARNPRCLECFLHDECETGKSSVFCAESGS